MHWHGDVLKREDGLVLKRALVFYAEDTSKKGRPIGHGRVRQRKKITVVLSWEDAPCQSSK